MQLIHTHMTFNRIFSTASKGYWEIKAFQRGEHTHTQFSLPVYWTSDQLIGDFEGATWSRVIGRAGSGCWLPGTPVHVPVSSPRPWRLTNEQAESSSSSALAWPCCGALRSDGGWQHQEYSNRWGSQPMEEVIYRDSEWMGWSCVRTRYLDTRQNRRTDVPNVFGATTQRRKRRSVCFFGH